MEKYNEFKRHLVSLLGELQAVIAQAEGNQHLFLRMTATTLEGAYKALLIFDGDVMPAAELLPKKQPKSPKKPKESKKSPPKRKYGTYGWVQLTDVQYANFVAQLGEAELKRCINYIDESAQTTGNARNWRDWNLVVHKCARDKWGISGYSASPKQPKPPMGNGPHFESGMELDMLKNFMEGKA